MRKFIDSDTPLTGKCQQLRGAGIQGVARYLHNLTRAEIAEIRNAGLALIVIDERRGDKATFERGKSGGMDDGVAAALKAEGLGLPMFMAIYWAVDYPAGQDDVASILDYGRSYANSLAARGGYQTGCYAPGLILRTLAAISVIDHAYRPGASGWPGTATFDGWSIRQYSPSVSLCGIEVDMCDVQEGSIGAWEPDRPIVPATTIPSPTANLTLPMAPGTAPPPTSTLSLHDAIARTVAALQTQLALAGLYSGPIDARPGPLTLAAISRWEAQAQDFPTP